MTKHLLAVLAVGLLVVAFLPHSASPVAPVAPASPVAKCLKDASKQDKARVAAYYSALADVVKRDASVITTTGLFRSVHANSLDLAFKGTDLPGKYKGLDVAIDEKLKAAIGLENVGLVDEKRAALVAALEGVAEDAR